MGDGGGEFVGGVATSEKLQGCHRAVQFHPYNPNIYAPTFNRLGEIEVLVLIKSGSLGVSKSEFNGS